MLLYDILFMLSSYIIKNIYENSKNPEKEFWLELDFIPEEVQVILSQKFDNIFIEASGICILGDINNLKLYFFSLDNKCYNDNRGYSFYKGDLIDLISIAIEHKIPIIERKTKINWNTIIEL